MGIECRTGGCDLVNALMGDAGWFLKAYRSFLTSWVSVQGRRQCAVILLIYMLIYIYIIYFIS